MTRQTNITESRRYLQIADTVWLHMPIERRPNQYMKAIVLCALHTAVTFTVFADNVALPDTRDIVDCVDPLIGVNGGGNVPPGACLPFSMMRLSPDTAPPQVTSGYTSKNEIIGFSHTHTSGTGGAGRYGNLLVTPQVGPLNLQDTSSSHTGDIASPGYYAVHLTKPNVKVELTATERCGVHRYTFSDTTQSRILINVSAVRTASSHRSSYAQCTASQAHFVTNTTAEGFVTAEGGWGNKAAHTVYFVAEFDQPATAVGSWTDGKASPDVRQTSGTDCGLYAEFNSSPAKPLTMRVGISFSSIDNARKHFVQTDGLSFDQVHRKVREIWRGYLDRIQVEGGSPTQRTCFYTAMYHTFLMPTDITGDNPDKAFKLPHFWDFYCIWDTWHCTNPLYTLIAPAKQAEIVNCLTEIFEHRGWLPDAWISSDFAYIQGGTDADIVLADAIVKQLPGINAERAYAAIRKDGVTPSDSPLRYGRYKEYFDLGYLPCTDITTRAQILCASSRTMEYALDDFCIANAAATLGKQDDAARFTSQSLNAWHLFDPSTKFFWAKDPAGNFLPGFKPDYHTPSGIGPFYEGTPWHYSCYVPHDMPGLIERHGGAQPFTAFLDQLFDTGQYNVGNEPDLLTPWSYAYVNRPDKNADRVRAILAKNYNTSRAGLPGNDDAGAMSAWYIFGSLGFYPNSGQDLYLVASPLFSKATVKLGDGEKLIVTAAGLSDKNVYVQSAKLNGQPLNRCWFRHTEISKGGTLEFQMGSEGGKWPGNGPLPETLLTKAEHR